MSAVTRAALYPRYSSEHQRGESITAQVRACKDYCKRKGYTIVAKYPEEARSATVDDRPAFQRMIADAKTGLFDVVVVHKLDRFARNRYDSAIYRRELRRAGVRLESVLEQLDGSPESIILESVLEGMNEYYSKNLAREVRKGMKETALQARHTGGKPPLGYDVTKKEKRYVINPREAQAVRIIFSMYAQGASYGQIAKVLDEGGFKTKRGKPFGRNSMHSILSNEKYTGVYIFNRAIGRKNGKFRHRQSKPASEIIRVPGGMPRIINDNLWETTRARMRAQRDHANRARNRARRVYLLSGLVRCGICGATYVGNTATNGQGRTYSFYECNRKNRTSECNNRRISKRKLESAVLRYLDDAIFSPEMRPAMAARVAKHYAAQRGHGEEEMRAIKKEITKLSTAIQNLLRLVEQGRATDSIVKRLEEREQEQQRLEDRLSQLEAQHQSQLTVAHVEEYLAEMHTRLGAKENEGQIKALVQKFVEHVVVFETDIEVGLRISLVTVGSGGAYCSVTKMAI